MKFNKLSKFAASFVALGLLSASAVPFTNAAKITQLPYSDNYDSYADETYTATFSNGTGNTGVTWFYLPSSTYASDDTLSLCNDDDAKSGHGKVVKYVNNTITTNTRIQYSFPKQESGKVVWKYDIKASNNYAPLNVRVGVDDASTDPRNLMIFDDNIVEFVGIEEKEDYTHLNWYTVVHIIDLDQGKQTTYYNGNTFKTEVAITAFSHAEFYWNSKEAKEVGQKDTVYIDNMTISVLPKTVSLSLFAEGKQISDVMPQTNKITVKLSDGQKFASIPEVTVTDLGNQIVKSETAVAVADKKMTDEGIEITLAEKLLPGHNYSVSLPDDLTTEFKEEISNKCMTFTCSKMSETWSEDFSGATSLNTPAVGTVLYDGSAFKFHTADAQGYEILEDSSYTGGKALKLTKKDSAVYVPVPTEQIKTGTLKINGHVIADDTAYTVVDMFYNSAATVPLIQFKNTVLHRYLHQANEETNGKESVSTSVYKDGVSGDVNFEMEMNFNDLSVPSAKALTDGKEYTWSVDSPRMPHRNTNKSNPVDILDYGVKFLKIKTGSTAIVDTFGYEYIPNNVAVLKDVTFITPDDNEVSYSAGNKLPAGTKVMKVKFSEAMNLASLNKIKVTGAEGDIPVTASETQDANTYLLTLETPLVCDSEYTVTVPETVVTTGKLKIYNPISDKVLTGDGVYEVSNLRITDADGNILSDIADYSGETVKVKVSVVNTTGKAQSVAVLLGGFDGIKLEEVGFDTLSINGIFEGDIELPVILEDKENLQYIKAFVFESMDNIKPVLRAVRVPELAE